MEKQSKNQIKADGINELTSLMIGALEAGFIQSNTFTLAQIHKIAQDHSKMTLGIDLPNITEQWGKETAKLCGVKHPT